MEEFIGELTDFKMVMKKIAKYIVTKLKFSQSTISFSAVISMDTILSKGVKILPNAKIGSSTIGAFTYIGDNCNFTYTRVGSFCSVGQEVLCGMGTHPLNFVSTYPGFYSAKAQGSIWFGTTHNFLEQKHTVIGSDVWIGARAIIMAGVKVGTGAIIGAGAVVTKDVPPYSIIVGIPGEIIKYRFDEQTIDKLLSSKWWELDEKTLRYLSKFVNEPLIFLENLDKLKNSCKK